MGSYILFFVTCLRFVPDQNFWRYVSCLHYKTLYLPHITNCRRNERKDGIVLLRKKEFFAFPKRLKNFFCFAVRRETHKPKCGVIHQSLECHRASVKKLENLR